MNNLESILYCFTALSLLFINNRNINEHTSTMNLRPIIINTFLALQLLPSSVVLFKVAHKTFTVCLAKFFPKGLENKFAGTAHEPPSEELPDRIIHPSEYSPLLE
jgi:hypothetical protein